MVGSLNIPSPNNNFVTYHRIGEKFLEWPEIPFGTDFILTSVSLWWLSETFPTSIYAYREVRIFTYLLRA